MKCPGNVKNDQRQTGCPVVSMHRHIIIWMLAANYTFVTPSLFSSSRTLKWTYPWLTSLDSNTSAVPYFLLASATFHAQKFFLYIISSCKHLSWAHFSLIGWFSHLPVPQCTQYILITHLSLPLHSYQPASQIWEFGFVSCTFCLALCLVWSEPSICTTVVSTLFRAARWGHNQAKVFPLPESIGSQ